MGTYRFSECKSCGLNELVEFMDFGKNPISTNYKISPLEADDTYKLSMAVCKNCGTVQLYDHIPEFKLVNPPSWLNYNEPESHLDSLVDEVIKFSNNQSAKVRGLSYKDKSTIDRFNNFGYRDAKTYDFSFNQSTAEVLNIEKLQKMVNPENCLKVGSIQQLADILLVRHVLEHTFDSKKFMSGIKCLMESTGIVVFEIPDCSKQFKKYDYTCLWEEHTIYFVESTFRFMLQQHGFKLEKFFTYKYATENSLVALCTLCTELKDKISSELFKPDIEFSNILLNFKNNFPIIKTKIFNFVLSQKKKGKVVIFGAGHLSITFIHLFGLDTIIDFVIDDDLNKCGKYIPGTGIKIRSSNSFLEEEIETCFLSLSPESEKRFMSKKSYLLNNVITIKSIFPGKDNSILGSIENDQ